MSIWITRPKVDGIALKARLSQLGISAFAEPLSEIEYSDFDIAVLTDAAGLIVTSRNGLKGFASAVNLSADCSDLKAVIETLKGRPLFAVGKATAEMAEELGFKDIRIGGGRAETLVEMVLKEAENSERSGRQNFYHLRGEKIAFDLEAALKERGAQDLDLHLMPVHCYKLSEAQILPSDLIERLTKKQINTVVLMSPRTTRIYIRLMKAYQLTEIAQDLHHCCLSDAVAEPLRQIGTRNVSVSEFPDQTHMIRLLKSLYLS